jgi:hypothetical protein
MFNGYFINAARRAFVALHPHWGCRMLAYTAAERAEEHDFMAAYMAGGEL